MNYPNPKKSIEAAFSIDFSDSKKPLFPLDIFAPAVVGEKYLIFYLARRPFAVAFRQISEVTLPLPTAALPTAPPWLAGIANLRGEIIPVCNLNRILGLAPSEFSNRAKFIVLHGTDSMPAVAFAVENVGEVVVLPSADITAADPVTTPHLFGTAVHQSDILPLISTQYLLSSPEVI